MTGSAEKVTLGRALVEAFLAEERRRTGVVREIPVAATALPLLIGPQGSTARELEESSGCRIKLDRIRKVVILKGR